MWFGEFGLWFTLGFTVLGIIFGGLFREYWKHRFSSPKLTISVLHASVSRDFSNSGEVEIPPELIEMSKKARFFPKIESRLGIVELTELVESHRSEGYLANAHKMQAFVLRFTDKPDETNIMAEWDNLSVLPKAMAMTLASAKAAPGNDTRSRMNELFTEVLESDDGPTVQETIRRRSALAAMKHFKDDFIEMEAAATVGLLNKIVTPILPELLSSAMEIEEILRQLQRFLDEQSKLTLPPKIEFVFDIDFVNAGTDPLPFRAFGMLEIDNEKAAPILVRLSPVDSKLKAKVVPGKGLESERFVTVSNGANALLERIAGDFSLESRRYRLHFIDAQGTRYSTSWSVFSAGAAQRDLEEFGKQVSSATGGRLI